MKFLKWLLIGIGAIIVLLLVVALFIPEDYHYEYSTEITEPREKIYPQVSNFHNWTYWSPFERMDTTMVTSIGDTAEGKGAYMSWESKSGDKGNQRIVDARDNEYLKTELYFMEDAEPAYSEWEFTEAGEGKTKVTWNLDAKMPYPIGRLMSLMMDSWMSDMYKKGLDSLAAFTAKLPDVPVKTQDMEAKTVAFVHVKVAAEDYQQALGAAYGQILTALASQQLEPETMPMGYWYQWEGDTLEFDAAFFVPSSFEATENVQKREQPVMTVLVVKHVGPYDNLGETHGAIDQALHAYGYDVTGTVWEEYVTDPGMEPDSSKWVTVIYYPVSR